MGLRATCEVLVCPRKGLEKDGTVHRKVPAYTDRPCDIQLLTPLRLYWQKDLQSAAKTPIAAKLGEEAATIPQMPMMAKVALKPIYPSAFGR